MSIPVRKGPNVVPEIIKTGLVIKAVSDLQSIEKNISELKEIEKLRLRGETSDRDNRDRSGRKVVRDFVREAEEEEAAFEKEFQEIMRNSRNEEVNETLMNEYRVRGIQRIRDLNLSISVQHLQVVERYAVKYEKTLAEAAKIFEQSVIASGMGFILREGFRPDDQKVPPNLDGAVFDAISTANDLIGKWMARTNDQSFCYPLLMDWWKDREDKFKRNRAG